MRPGAGTRNDYLGFDDADPRLSHLNDDNIGKQKKTLDLDSLDLQKSSESIGADIGNFRGAREEEDDELGEDEEDDEDGIDLQKQLDQIKSDLGRSQAMKSIVSKYAEEDDEEDDEDEDGVTIEKKPAAQAKNQQSTIANLISKYQKQL